MDKELALNLIKDYERAVADKATEDFTVTDYSWNSRTAIESLEYDESGAVAALMTKKSWNSFLEGSSLKIKDILENEERLERIKNFDKIIKKGSFAEFYSDFLIQLGRLAGKFSLDIADILEDESKAIDIFVEAYENIYKKYTVDRFLCQDGEESEPVILTYEYHFKTLEDFVKCLKRSENCIAYALIDSLYDYEDVSFTDTFFAFGCRYGKYVYINSNRPYHATPKSRAIKNKRNPQKKLKNEAANTWMPLYDLTKLSSSNQVSSSTDVVELNQDTITNRSISEIYDKEARLIICSSMFAVYQKYVVNKTTDIRYNHIDRKRAPIQDSYFGDEISLLPCNTTAVALPGQLNLPTPSKNEVSISHPSLFYKDVTFYDWYFKEYITDKDLTEPIVINEFVGTKEEAEQRAWWQYRKNALDLVNKRRKEDIASCYYDENLEETLKVDPDNEYQRYPSLFRLKDFRPFERLMENVYNIIKIGLTRCSSNAFGNGTKQYREGIELGKEDHVPVYEIMDNPEYFVDSINASFNYSSSDCHFYKGLYERSDWKKYNESFSVLDIAREGLKEPIQSSYKRRKYEQYKVSYDKDLDLYVNISANELIIVPTYTEGKSYLIRITPNTFWDLMTLFNCKREELPKALQRYLSDKYSFKPYTGNSILDVTDPMAEIKDWTDDKFELDIIILLSKRDIQNLEKKLGVKCSVDLDKKEK